MYCSKCGSELPDNALFCLSCGAKTKEDQPQSKVKKGFIIGALVFAILSLFIIMGIPYSYISMSSSLGGYIFIIVFNILLIVSILCLNKIKKWMVVPIVGFLLYDLLFLHSNLAKIYFTRGPQFFVHPTIKGIIVFLILISLCFLTLFGNGYVKKIAGVLSALIFIAVAYWLFKSMLLYEDEVLHSVHRAYGGNINFTHVFRFIFDFNDFRHIIKAYKLIYCRSLYYLACAVISLGVSFSEKIVKQPNKAQYVTTTNNVTAQETSSSQESEQPAPAPTTDAYHPMPGDAKSTGLAILCFFFPMIGLILWLVWKDQYPLKASSCSKGAIIGVIVYVLLIIVIYALEFIVIYNIWH